MLAPASRRGHNPFAKTKAQLSYLLLSKAKKASCKQVINFVSRRLLYIKESFTCTF